MAAIGLLLEPNTGLVQDTGDGYVTLRISPAFVSEATLNNAFALGALCAIFLVKAHSMPGRVSPALIQTAIGGVDSIMDHNWVMALNSDTAETLSLLPSDPLIPIPTSDQRLDYLLQAHLNCMVLPTTFMRFILFISSIAYRHC